MQLAAQRGLGRKHRSLQARPARTVLRPACVGATQRKPIAAAPTQSPTFALNSAAQHLPLAPSKLVTRKAGQELPYLKLDAMEGLTQHNKAVLLAAAAALPVLLSAHPALAAVEFNPQALLSVFTIPGIVGDDPIREGLVSGFLLIFFSEIGDKTFFIALLLALRQPKSLVFAGTFGALAVMTVVSVLLGQVLHVVDELVPQGGSRIPLDDVLAAALLIWFGVRTIQDAKDAKDDAAEEKEEAEEVVEGFSKDDSKVKDAAKLVLSTFALVFAAEWGDKSFLATIALAAASSPLGVTAGAVAGHGVATGLAVAGGGFLSRYFSESFLQYVGGSLFLVFAGATIADIFFQIV